MPTPGSETLLRLGTMLAVLAAMMLWEIAAPARRTEIPRLLRWTNNLALVLLDAALVRLVFPVTLAAFAARLQSGGWGLFALIPLPDWTEVLLALLLLDLAIWAQHRAFHAIPALWRLHRVHHADLHFDTTTGLRFHPVEILLSMAIKFALVAALGAPAVAVLAFEVILNAASLFNHGNVRLPARAERLVRLVLVTPDMHRIHHSWHRDETDSNFGFSLAWWDRLFGTYRAKPRGDLTIGITDFRDPAELRLDRMLVQPLRNPPDQP